MEIMCCCCGYELQFPERARSAVVGRRDGPPQGTQTLLSASEKRPDAVLRPSLAVSVANALLSKVGTFAACMALAVVRHAAQRILTIGMGCGRWKCGGFGSWFRISAKKR
jgi:hypothetical protein